MSLQTNQNHGQAHTLNMVSISLKQCKISLNTTIAECRLNW